MSELLNWISNIETCPGMMIIHGFIILGLVYLYFRKAGTERKLLFWSAWLFKLGMSVAVGLIYLYYYTANDTWSIFNDACRLANLARSDGWTYLDFILNSHASDTFWSELTFTQSRTLFFVKVLSFFAWIGGNNYWIAALYFATLSFFSSWNLFLVVVRYVDGSQPAAILAFLFFPSIGFWSSGIIKETLALSGIYWLTALFIRVMSGTSMRPWHWIGAGVAVWVAWNLKYYWTALFMSVTITSLGIYFIQKRSSFISRHKMISWLAIFFVLCITVSLLHPNFYLSRFLEVLISNHDNFVRISKPEGLIQFYDLHASWWSVLLNAPWALFSSLFRPWLGEATGWTSWLAAFENLMLVVLTIALAFRKDWKITDRMILLSGVVYIVLLCIFLALSTPNLGTLSRYRVGCLPFFVFLISYRNPLVNYFVGSVSFFNR